MLAQLFFAGANIFYKMLCFDTFRLKWFKLFVFNRNCKAISEHHKKTFKRGLNGYF